ncbi:MAG: hypothetical protein VB070_05020 [Clostridiaceae bacterium]|nr:hypothetical protein [Clostridiaceae bacterium]
MMNEKELLKKACNAKMPNFEEIRKKCINQDVQTSVMKSHKTIWIIRLASVAVCAGFALVAIYALPHMNNFNSGIIDPSQISHTNTDNSSVNKAIESESQQNIPTKTSDIMIHELTQLPSADKMNIALKTEDFIKMNKQELCNFYGINVFPTVLPNDMNEVADAVYGIFKRDKGTGDIYYSQNVLNYVNSSETKYLNIELSKGQLPYTDIATFTNNKNEKSTINGNELFIGHYSIKKNEYYYAEFLYHDVGFRITANNLTQNEFVETLTSIIQ